MNNTFEADRRKLLIVRDQLRALLAAHDHRDNFQAVHTGGKCLKLAAQNSFPFARSAANQKRRLLLDIQCLVQVLNGQLHERVVLLQFIENGSSTKLGMKPGLKPFCLRVNQAQKI